MPYRDSKKFILTHVLPILGNKLIMFIIKLYAELNALNLIRMFVHYLFIYGDVFKRTDLIKVSTTTQLKKGKK